MTTLSINELSVAIPEDVQVVAATTVDWIPVYRLDGSSISMIGATIRNDAVSIGYVATENYSAVCVLKRGERTIILNYNSPTQLSIVFEDGEALPRAQFASQSIRLASLELTLPAGVEIRAGRERRGPGPDWVKAIWYLYGVKAVEIATHIHHELNKKGLTSKAVWPPGKGDVPPHWKVEGERGELFVQAHLTEHESHTELEVDVLGALKSAEFCS
ncbi:hypothetical protein [Chondromyces crocatus]|uniref:Uncharacterized protein n=1 Tax=Chondromyces crocatus TaxID=52 RepID=A0A0K1ES16_CHOCO|nr:hypothetical protein [Chondromyces crocatus]AKT43579.1 uncharacterized protein CMC5_078120 [Chondromyces crocatus]